jgi:hypothetical protein
MKVAVFWDFEKSSLMTPYPGVVSWRFTVVSEVLSASVIYRDDVAIKHL